MIILTLRILLSVDLFLPARLPGQSWLLSFGWIRRWIRLSAEPGWIRLSAEPGWIRLSAEPGWFGPPGFVPAGLICQ